MKFVFAPIATLSVFAGLLAAQTVPQTQPSPAQAQTQSQPAAQQPSTQPSENQPSNGKLIFSRSTDDNGATTTTIGPAAQQGTDVTAPTASDEERDAVSFVAYDLELHLEPAKNAIAVRARMTICNAGKVPLMHVPLQISSTLKWERIEIGGKDVPFTVATLESDTDHTGQLHEAAVTLAAPLAPMARIELVASYSGTITPSSLRLTQLGTPDDVALHSDWDEIGVEFTGLRGFGNVAWYPVSAVPVILGDGARLFDEVGEVKSRDQGARFRLRLTDEFPHGQAPTVVLVNGRRLTPNVVDLPNPVEGMPGVATADSGETLLGFTVPSIFVAMRQLHTPSNVAIWTTDADNGDANLKNWSTAAAAVSPFLATWLGENSRTQLSILDLPDAADAPFESGSLLATPVRADDEARLEGVLAHAMTHAWLGNMNPTTNLWPVPEWFHEGVAHFMGALWLEKQSGRTRALESLEAGRAALALAEPSSPGESAGQPLERSYAPSYYRTKAAYVLWMLRDMVGDQALGAALRDYYERVNLLIEPYETFEKVLEHESKRDLSWFFADWVDADKGLPDLAIDGVFPEAAEAGNTLVAVGISNSGYAGAEVSVTVSGMGGSVSKRVIVPGRGKTTVRILLIGKPAQVQVNDGSVPETGASVHIRRLDAAGSSSQQQPDAP